MATVTMAELDLADLAANVKVPRATVLKLRLRVDHFCVQHAEEIGMSDCDYGCKVFRCAKCHTKATVHSWSYGCRDTKAL